MPALRKIFKKNFKGRLGLSLSVPAAVILGIVLLCVIGWAFFMGLMVGRGQNPQTQLEAMTGGLLKRDAAPTPAAPPEPAMEEAPLEESGGESPAPEPAAAAQQPFTRPQGQGMNAWGPAPADVAQPKAASQPQAARPQPKPRPKPAQQAAKPTHAYVLQAAVFKNTRDAENLRTTLRGKGINSQIRKSGKAFLVVISLKGAETDLSALEKKLSALKLGKPLVLSKKPLDATSKKKR